ncbi:MAG: PEP-CTERM sorting domain-containing protein [Gammaproteobacteria bacterium]|nr:PEP-CTERM sorting domain-containing protein [Gammaproteobacteria bacterium]
MGRALFGFEGVNRASGILNMTDSELIVGPHNDFPGQAALTVGFSSGPVAEATGQVTLTRSHIAAERLNPGSGSHLIFDIEGLTRIGQYGAIDIAGCVGLTPAQCTVSDPGFANLAGIAEIRFDALFDFEAALGGVFDLIVAGSFSFDGISGGQLDTYFDTVLFSGLDPAYAATAFIFDDDHEIFRVALSRAAIPEPGVLLMLAGGAVLLALSRRRGRIWVGRGRYGFEER